MHHAWFWAFIALLSTACACWTVGVWTGSEQWGLTGLILLLPTVVAAILAAVERWS